MISDERLRLALEEYDKAIMAALPEPSACNHQFSRRFERKMRGVFRMAKHPVAYKALQRAACILLALLALFGGVIAFNPDVRAAVIHWVKEQIGQFSRYYHTGETIPESAQHKHYELGWLPEGYVYMDRLTEENDETVVYVNDSDRLLYFSCFYQSSDGPFLNTSMDISKTIFVGNLTADLYLSQAPNYNSAIVWTDPESGLLFSIFADTSEEDLIKLMQHVTEKK